MQRGQTTPIGADDSGEHNAWSESVTWPGSRNSYCLSRPADVKLLEACQRNALTVPNVDVDKPRGYHKSSVVR
jgi:hypothetical protein